MVRLLAEGRERGGTSQAVRMCPDSALVGISEQMPSYMLNAQEMFCIPCSDVYC